MKSLVLYMVMVFVGCKASSAPSTKPNCIENYPILNQMMQAVDSEVTHLESSNRGHAQTVDDVSAQLANMYAVDQFVREVQIPSKNDYDSDAISCFKDAINRRYVDVGLRNTAALKSLIGEFGWIRISLFGEDADRHAFMLAQHSDLDRAFQEEVLTLLEPLALDGDTNPMNFAYLYDRLAMADNKPQRYGTQGSCTLEGGLNPLILENAAGVDRLRASVGLPDLELGRVSLEISCVERFGR